MSASFLFKKVVQDTALQMQPSTFWFSTLINDTFCMKHSIFSNCARFFLLPAFSQFIRCSPVQYWPRIIIQLTNDFIKRLGQLCYITFENLLGYFFLRFIHFLTFLSLLSFADKVIKRWISNEIQWFPEKRR